MRKYLLIPLLGAISISLTFGRNDIGLLNINKDSIETPVAHSVGKKLVKGAWLLGGTLSAKSNNLSDIDLLVVDVKNFNQRAFNVRLEGSYFY